MISFLLRVGGSVLAGIAVVAFVTVLASVFIGKDMQKRMFADIEVATRLLVIAVISAALVFLFFSPYIFP